MRTTRMKKAQTTTAPSIPWNPDGLILALQFYQGDRERAFALARMLADLEPIRRNDCALYLCCNSDVEQDEEFLGVQRYCENKMLVGAFQSERSVPGYPAGPNALWADTMEHFYRAWNTGSSRFESVFTFEADGVPLRRDWINMLIEAHKKTLAQRCMITASVQSQHEIPHPNGNLIAHVSIIRNYPELLETPPKRPWDMYHRATLCRLARHDAAIRSEHNSSKWTAEDLAGMAQETAWLHGCKDDSAWKWAKRELFSPKPAKVSIPKPATKVAKMRIYCCHSDSHRQLFERHFKATLPPSLELVAHELPQECETGAFESEGFQATCAQKIGHLIEILSAKVGSDPFIFSDVDIRFYGDPVPDLTKLLGRNDMLFQDDGPGGACTGFMVLRPTESVLEFWRVVLQRMIFCGEMDQDATNRLLVESDAPPFGLLPDRYWTIAKYGHEWDEGDAVNPPADLIMHHANGTCGVRSKLSLLKAVNEAMAAGKGRAPEKDSARPARERVAQAVQIIESLRPAQEDDAQECEPVSECAPPPEPPVVAPPPPPVRQRFPFGYPARMLLDNMNLQAHNAEMEPDRLAVILSFWRGDKARAMELARLLADMEPTYRPDVTMVFSRQKTTPVDEDLARTIGYCESKFPVIHFEADVDERKPYPGIAFEPWASAMAWFSDSYYNGTLPCENAFFIEPDGFPLRATWINDIKRAHRETLLLGKRITGARMRFGGHDHINGTMVVHASLWPDRQSLHRCNSHIAWDVFHGRVLVAEASASEIIRNEWGATDITAAMFLSMSMESCWLTSVKDRSGFGHAEALFTGGAR